MQPENTAPIPPTTAQAVANSVDMPNAYTQQQSTAYTQPFSPTQPYPQAQAYPQGQPYPQAQAYAPAQAPAKKKSKLPVLIAIVGVILLGLVVVNVFRGFNLPNPIATSTPDMIVDQAVRDIKDLNFEGLLNSVPPELLEYGLARSGYNTREQLVAALNEQVAQLDEQISLFGLSTEDILKVINIETNGLSYYSEDGLASLKNEWNSRIPGFGDSIENAATVNVEFTGEIELFGQKLSLSDYIDSASQPITVAQIDGQWYLLEPDLGDMGELANLL